MKNELRQLAVEIGDYLKSKLKVVVTAESCTGGWLAKILTDLPGSSLYFERGFVTYSDFSKIEMLGVQKKTLETWGAVSEQTVREMAQGALVRSKGNLSLAISGIAGPDGGTTEKPVGTVWFAWAQVGDNTIVERKIFEGNRDSVRGQAVATSLRGIYRFD